MLKKKVFSKPQEQIFSMLTRQISKFLLKNSSLLQKNIMKTYETKVYINFVFVFFISGSPMETTIPSQDLGLQRSFFDRGLLGPEYKRF